MIAAVIPTRCEGDQIKLVLTNLLRLPIDLLIPVINGCTDNTSEIIDKISVPKIHPILFKESLGIDIPRAIGAKKAMDLSATGVIFVDGDMVGDFSKGLLDLINALENEKIDIALTNCYPQLEESYDSLALLVLKYRRLLNIKLNLFNTIGVGSPSHGPHGVSKKLVSLIGYKALAIPPLSLALAKLNNLSIKIAANIPHEQLGSSFKGNLHSELIAETIIGDCLEAIHHFENRPSGRSWGNRKFLGYHNERRWDLLHEYINNPET